MRAMANTTIFGASKLFAVSSTHPGFFTGCYRLPILLIIDIDHVPCRRLRLEWSNHTNLMFFKISGQWIVAHPREKIKACRVRAWPLLHQNFHINKLLRKQRLWFFDPSSIGAKPHAVRTF